MTEKGRETHPSRPRVGPRSNLHEMRLNWGTRTQDRNGVVELQPFLGVGEVVLAGVLAELRLEGCDDPADVVLGAAVGARHEDHAVVSWAAGQHGLHVERAEI